MAGGYREPSKPAAHSGPGRLSRRTDGGPAQKLRELPDAQYGEAATFRDQQKSAPLAQASPTRLPGEAASAQATPPTPLSAPSERPDEPVTAGANAGPGPGMGALALPSPQAQEYESAYDFINALAAENPDVSSLGYLAASIGRGL